MMVKLNFHVPSEASCLLLPIPSALIETINYDAKFDSILPIQFRDPALLHI